MKKFRAYQLAIKFYNYCDGLEMPQFLRDQVLRASSSVALNLSEGSARRGQRDRLRFFNVAYASYCEAVTGLDLAKVSRSAVQKDLIDHLGACLYRLARPSTTPITNIDRRLPDGNDGTQSEI